MARDPSNLAQLFRAANQRAEATPLVRRALVILLKFTHRTGHVRPKLRVAVGNQAG